jgi:hypothetical protein
MTRRIMFATGAGGLALALVGATPAPAQIESFAFGAMNSQLAADRCTAAVQYRLSHREGIKGYGGQHHYGQVLTVTQVDARRNFVRVRGLAASDRVAFGPYNSGAYGALGLAQANQVADVTFRCDVDYRGQVLTVDHNRRR